MKKNNKGFTLVELLAVIVILGILCILAIPAFAEVYSSIKDSNRNAKIQELEKAAEKYGSKIKDKVKDGENHMIKLGSSNQTSAQFLIEKGYISSDSDTQAVIIDPVNNSPMNGDIFISYCNLTYDIEAHYVNSFSKNKVYYAGDYVASGNIFYVTTITFKPTKVYNDNEEKKCPNSSDKDVVAQYRKKYGSKWVEQCRQRPIAASVNGDFKDIVNPLGEHFFQVYECQKAS